MTHPQTTDAIAAFLASDLGQATIHRGYTDVVEQVLKAFVAGIDIRRWRMEPAAYATRVMNTCLGYLSQAGYLQALRIPDARHDPELWAAVWALVDVEVRARHTPRAAGLAEQDCEDLREQD